MYGFWWAQSKRGIARVNAIQCRDLYLGQRLESPLNHTFGEVSYQRSELSTCFVQYAVSMTAYDCGSASTDAKSQCTCSYLRVEVSASRVSVASRSRWFCSVELVSRLTIEQKIDMRASVTGVAEGMKEHNHKRR